MSGIVLFTSQEIHLSKYSQLVCARTLRSSCLGLLSVATVSGARFISLERFIVASQGPFLVATSTKAG